MNFAVTKVEADLVDVTALDGIRRCVVGSRTVTLEGDYGGRIILPEFHPNEGMLPQVGDNYIVEIRPA